MNIPGHFDLINTRVALSLPGLTLSEGASTAPAGGGARLLPRTRIGSPPHATGPPLPVTPAAAATPAGTDG